MRMSTSTSIIKPNIRIILIARVPSSQALPGFLITAPPSVCVPDVIGMLAVWIQKKKNRCHLYFIFQQTMTLEL